MRDVAPRRPAVALTLALFVVASPVSSLGSEEREYRERMGLLALDRYLETWNTRNPERWVTSLHFPHVRPGPGAFEVWATREDYLANVDFDRVLATGWEVTRWDDRRVLHVGRDKVHVAGWWNRLDSSGASLLKGQMVYVVTHRNGLWRLEARLAAGSPEDDARASDEHRRRPFTSPMFVTATIGSRSGETGTSTSGGRSRDVPAPGPRHASSAPR